jgi:hypothetical protein
MLKSGLAAAALALAITVPCAIAQEAKSPWPAGAKVYIISPKNGETVKSPVKVVFGLEGMGVAPAGVEKEKTGHHHLLIDTKLPADLEMPIPADDHDKHFGSGQTETSVALTPGEHTLQLLMGDAAHVPHNPPLASEAVRITVK